MIWTIQLQPRLCSVTPENPVFISLSRSISIFYEDIFPNTMNLVTKKIISLLILIWSWPILPLWMCVGRGCGFCLHYGWRHDTRKEDARNSVSCGRHWQVPQLCSWQHWEDTPIQTKRLYLSKLPQVWIQRSRPLLAWSCIQYCCGSSRASGFLVKLMVPVYPPDQNSLHWNTFHFQDWWRPPSQVSFRFDTVARYLNWWSLCILLLSIYFYSLLIVQVQNL